MHDSYTHQVSKDYIAIASYTTMHAAHLVSDNPDIAS